MTLGEKVRTLRTVEGDLRGFGRAMSQQEIVRAIHHDTGQSFSQSYLSQVESGARPHLTERTRLLLARFFKIHPGYLVSDPPGFHTELASELRTDEAPLDEWLRGGALKFSADPELHEALLRIAGHDDSRRCLALLGAIIDTPDLVDRLLDTLKRDIAAPPAGSHGGPDVEWLQ
jgi:transcriptional regulator with XRE-family HTH domain